jgi:hypothetical protein
VSPANATNMSNAFFDDWMEQRRPNPAVEGLVVLHEKARVDSAVEAAIRGAALDHLVGLDLLARIGGYPETEAFVRNKLPTDKRVMSGDLGEILASEYIDQCMGFDVPIKRLRWKDDRDTTMRGNDVLAIAHSKEACRLLKAESKSRETLSAHVVGEAVVGLEKHSGRPNPSSLAFISARLRESGNDSLAVVFEELQSGRLKADAIDHLVFTFSGNDPTNHLKKHVASNAARRRHLVGCVVAGHQDFIRRTFATLNATNR